MAGEKNVRAAAFASARNRPYQRVAVSCRAAEIKGLSGDCPKIKAPYVGSLQNLQGSPLNSPDFKGNYNIDIN